MRFLCLILALLPLSARYTGDSEFRARMNGFVSEGNRQYEMSNRAGIMAMADSLRAGLSARSAAGLLNPVDSLEYTADLYKLLGDWHYENGSYDKTSYAAAESFLLKALGIYGRPEFSADLDKGPLIHREMAQLYYKLERYGDALEQIRTADAAYGNAWLNQLFFDGDPLWNEWLDVQMQGAICLARLGRSEEALAAADSLTALFEPGSPGYFEAIRKKGKIIMLSGADGREKLALPFYREYFGWRRKDAVGHLRGLDRAARQDYWMRSRPFMTDCLQLEAEDPALMFDVALLSKGLLLAMENSGPESLACGWKEIQERLPSGSCAVECIQYSKDGRKLMGAVVLRKSGDPEWVGMMAPDEFYAYEIDGRSNFNRLSSSSGKARNPVYLDERLKELLWPEGLRKAIGDCSRVYFSPDGYLHQVAAEYMLPKSLSGKEFFRLSSTRVLMSVNAVQLDSALIVGGVDYGASVADAGAAENDTRAFSYLKGAGVSFPQLLYTGREASDIYKARACASDTLLMHGEASETAVRGLMERYPVLSVSTHGYFKAPGVSEGTELKPCLRDETMSLCGLALAGANRSLSDSSADPGTTDGILSAEEIAGLNLHGLGLAILSACQTGLGEITEDGVFGLQRGFKMAGAGCLLVSLWNVNDEATCLLITRMHELMASGMSVHRAFNEARASLAASSRTVHGTRFNPASLTQESIELQLSFDEPVYTNAFILIDATI